MKFSRIAASGAGLALIAASTFVGAVASNADDIDVIVPSPLPTETNPYSAGWFAGEVAGGNGTAVQSAAGLVITGGDAGFQILNGDPVNGAPVSLSDAIYYQSVSTLGDEAYFQIAVFGEPEAEFTTLRPVNAAEIWGDWTTSQSVAGLVANESYTKDELIAALDGGASAAQVLAYGLFVNAGETSTVRAIYFNNNTYYFASARPTLTVNPTVLTVAEAANPVTLSGAGFAPGETVDIGIGYGNSGDSLGEAVADANGAFTFTYSFVGVTEPFTGTFFAGDSSGIFSASAEFSVVANPVVPTTPVTPTTPTNVLPATGFDANSALLLGGVLLLAGAGIALVTLRRQSAA